jgi:predicted dehydrogenase
MEVNEDENLDSGLIVSRRNLLKALATVPLVGLVSYGAYKKQAFERDKRVAKDILNIGNSAPRILAAQPNGKTIRLGIIGNGVRGKMLLRAVGFAEPELLEKWKNEAKKNKKDTRYEDYLNQDNLNVLITAVCDIFDTNAEIAIRSGANINKEGLNGKYGTKPKYYRNYKELLAANDVDAVIIATPDHWHSTLTIAAALAGKHVYCEKPLSWTVPETYAVRKAVKESGIVFQLGHQNRHTDSYHKAKEIIQRDILGPVSLIEVCTNRNNPNGAWVYDIHPSANKKTIDWKQFIPPPNRMKEYTEYMLGNKLEKFMGPDSYNKFSLERFFRWRCWWDYSTGLSGDLLTHEYDAINQIMEVGIPHSATSSGGIYFYKDGRTVPDVLTTAFEFPKKNLTLLYSATLANNRKRGKVIMGHDASMELGDTLTISVDSESTKYKDKIDAGIIQPGVPFYTYVPGSNNIDGFTSATEMYFAQRGLLYTYVNGIRYDTTFLHIREWLECIRQGLTPSCNIDHAFEEAITAHMGTRSYLEGRTKYWDSVNEIIVNG